MMSVGGKRLVQHVEIDIEAADQAALYLVALETVASQIGDGFEHRATIDQAHLVLVLLLISLLIIPIFYLN